MLQQFFKEETTWFPDHVGYNLMAAIFIFVSMVMSVFPMQVWQWEDVAIVCYGYAMGWMGVSFYLQRFTNYREGGQSRSIYGLLRYLPVSGRQLQIFVMKKAAKMCLWLTGITGFCRSVYSIVFLHTWYIGDILLPFASRFIIPIGVLELVWRCGRKGSV